MSLIKWDPFSGRIVSNAGHWLDDFDDLVGGKGNLEVYEDEQNLVIKANMPGVDAEDINISMSNGLISISAEHKSEEDKSEGRVYHRRMNSASYAFSVKSPFPVDMDLADAEIKKGILEVKIPKSNKSDAKKLIVKSA